MDSCNLLGSLPQEVLRALFDNNLKNKINMNFQYSEDHLAIRDAAREFAENEIAASAVERDKTGEFPAEIVQKLGELGFMGMSVSPEWGGAGLDTVSYVLAIEEV